MKPIKVCLFMKPTLYDLASAAGLRVKMDGYITVRGFGRVAAVLLDGRRMSAGQARRWLLSRYRFVTRSGYPCEG